MKTLPFHSFKVPRFQSWEVSKFQELALPTCELQKIIRWVGICIYGATVEFLMYIRNLCICVCVYVGVSCIYVCGHFYVYHFLCISSLKFYVFAPVIFHHNFFVKVIDFTAGDVMRGHGHFWWIYPPGARFRYGASLLDFRHVCGLLIKK